MKKIPRRLADNIPPMTAEDDIQAFAEDIVPQFRSR